MTSPAIFVSHGAPSIVLDASPSHAFLEELGRTLPRPRAVVCASAHWETQRVSVNLAAHPETIHDFSGFPEELYRVRYPAPGEPKLGHRALELLGAAGMEATGDERRGFDHGVWTPLALIFPDAGIPVVEISVQPHLPAEHHFAIGQALRPLRDEGILVLGSGSTTHNLRDLGRQSADGPPEYVRTFEAWVCDAVAEARIDDLLHYEERAPYARRNHPTPEHFLPLFVSLGAASDGAHGQVLNRHFEYGVLSMAGFTWA